MKITCDKRKLMATLGAIQKVCHRPRGEGVKQNSDKEWKGGWGSSKIEMSPFINFQEKFPWETAFVFCNTSYFKVWTTFPIMLISFAPLLLVVHPFFIRKLVMLLVLEFLKTLSKF